MNEFIPAMEKLNFHTDFVTWSFRNNSNTLILCSINIYLYYHVENSYVYYIFVETMNICIGFLINIKFTRADFLITG